MTYLTSLESKWRPKSSYAMRVGMWERHKEALVCAFLRLSPSPRLTFAYPSLWYNEWSNRKLNDGLPTRPDKKTGPACYLLLISLRQRRRALPIWRSRTLCMFSNSRTFYALLSWRSWLWSHQEMVLFKGLFCSKWIYTTVVSMAVLPNSSHFMLPPEWLCQFEKTHAEMNIYSTSLKIFSNKTLYRLPHVKIVSHFATTKTGPKVERMGVSKPYIKEWSCDPRWALSAEFYLPQTLDDWRMATHVALSNFARPESRQELYDVSIYRASDFHNARVSLW